MLGAAIIGTVFNIVGPKILGLATTKLFTDLVAKFEALGKNQAISKALAHNPKLPVHQVPVPGIDFGYIGDVLLILLGLYIISAIFMYIQQYLMAGVAQRNVYRLRKEVDEKLSRLPLKYFDGRTHGEILSRAVNDMDNISTTLQQSVTQLITSAVTLLGVLVMMLTISWVLSLIVLVTLATEHVYCHGHCETFAGLLQETAALAWRTQRPCRRDVYRPQDRQSLWTRRQSYRPI